MINKSFWKGKRVLITGHTGFKGGWLSIWIKNLGAQVIGYSLKPKPGDNYLFYKSVSLKKVKSFYGNILNF